MSQITNNEIEILEALPKFKAISSDKLPNYNGDREGLINNLVKLGFVKKDSYWNCWITNEGKNFLKNKH